MNNKEQICIVCERDISILQVAPNVRPGDLVICQDCDKVTPNRAQAEAHFRRHSLSWLRHVKIEEAAQKAYKHFSGLNDRGLLTNEEIPLIKELGEALKMQKSGDPE